MDDDCLAEGFWSHGTDEEGSGRDTFGRMYFGSDLFYQIDIRCINEPVYCGVIFVL